VWPFELQVQKEDRNFELYQQVLATTAGRLKVPTIDLVNAFIDHSERELFLDHVHASQVGCELVADILSRVVPEVLAPQSR